MTTELMKELPKWALYVVIALLVPLSGYTVWAHIDTDNTQSEDIKTLAATVANLTVVVEYNYKETERNSATAQANADTLHETQMRLERIMGRIEARLDEGVN